MILGTSLLAHPPEYEPRIRPMARNEPRYEARRSTSVWGLKVSQRPGMFGTDSRAQTVEHRQRHARDTARRSTGDGP